MSSLKSLGDDRINALFATITKEEDGTYSQSALDKLRFWKKEIETLSGMGKGPKLILNTLNLQSKFEINGLTPLCLDEVLKWMIDQKDLQDESEFAYQTTVISSIVGWSLGMFFGTNQDEPTATARDLVYTKLVKEYSERIATTIGAKDSVMGKLQFDQLCHEVGLQSEQDIDVVKRYLVFTKQLYQKTDHDVWACKFGAEVEESDFGVLKIKRTVKVLQGIISDLDAEILKSKAEAKMLVALGLSTRALHHLRIAKKFDLVLQQRLSSLDILDNLLSKINQSRTELDILSAYEVGTKTLKEILKKDELQLDNIQDTMDALTDVLEDQEEISNAMASVEEFDEDLENELDALIQSATATPLKGQSSSDIISQPGTPQRVPATETAALSRENSKIGLKRPALAGGSGPPSRNSSDGIENKLEQLKVSTPKLKKKVAEMIPAE